MLTSILTLSLHQRRPPASLSLLQKMPTPAHARSLRCALFTVLVPAVCVDPCACYHPLLLLPGCDTPFHPAPVPVTAAAPRGGVRPAISIVFGLRSPPSLNLVLFDDAMTKIMVNIFVELIRAFALLVEKMNPSDGFIREFIIHSTHLTQLNPSSAVARYRFKGFLATLRRALDDHSASMARHHKCRAGSAERRAYVLVDDSCQTPSHCVTARRNLYDSGTPCHATPNPTSLGRRG
ncbi:hypothetical protein BC834DRAFT_880788 [Gloeopeniophorella convolvens]|nr:hypothetical protein BC834DRAFT_880788 [Gloeopeniophorella convolvens]